MEVAGPQMNALAMKAGLTSFVPLLCVLMSVQMMRTSVQAMASVWQPTSVNVGTDFMETTAQQKPVVINLQQVSHVVAMACATLAASANATEATLAPTATFRHATLTVSIMLYVLPQTLVTAPKAGQDPCVRHLCAL